MANFVSGMIKGGVLAGVALVTASVLLPARPKIAPTDVAQSTPVEQVQVDTASTEPKPTPTDPAVTEPAPTAPSATETIASEAPAKANVAAVPEPIKPVAPPVTEPVAKEALLDPSTDIAAPNTSGAKIVAAPAEGSLPKIGEDTIAATSQSSATAQAAVPQPVQPVIAAPAIDGLPLQKYAAKFDNLGTKPLFAVILRDTGAKDLDRATLAALPFPVTFAVDPEQETSTEAMAIYRAAGKEVVMLTAGLPNGATAQDLEQSFQTYDKVLPETVAVMGPAKGGFQDNAVLSKLIVPVIAAQGRGLITFDRGLNSAAQNAVREGLANATVFRQIDGGGETIPVIRRYLDRAVFKAAQDGAAMVMGETLPDTITALTEWSLEGRAADVTLVPVSAILR